MPSERLVRMMANANPHGFGFATENRIFKTLDIEEFIQELKTISTESKCILHFRYATHGSIKVENCHPFVSDGVVMAHNGVLSIPSTNDKTDSQICLERVVAPAIRKYGILRAKKYIDAVREGTRFAVMYKGHIHLYGNFETYGGYYFSNLRFLYNYSYYRNKQLHLYQ